MDSSYGSEAGEESHSQFETKSPRPGNLSLAIARQKESRSREHEEWVDLIDVKEGEKKLRGRSSRTDPDVAISRLLLGAQDGFVRESRERHRVEGRNLRFMERGSGRVG